VKVLVTGAGGFLGRYAVNQLHGAGHEVIGLFRGAGAAVGCKSLQIDLLSAQESQWATVEAQSAELLVHLAWCTEPGVYWQSPLNSEWVTTSVELARRFIRGGGRRIVGVGSCAEYTWGTDQALVEASSPVQASTPYGEAKVICHQQLTTLCGDSGVDLYWGRVFFPYGPGEACARLLPSALGAMMRGEPVRCSHGAQRRDFIHAADVAAALLHLGQSGADPGAYNVSSGIAVSIRELVERCSALTASISELQFGVIPVPPDDPALILGDNRKLVATGWQPQYSLERGLAAYIDSLHP
jgi:nucleoside-diphosphate-sugar epimerase